MSTLEGKRRLTKDVSINELRELRSEGLTNKKIAERLGISVATVYRYIGKRSNDVMNAEAQNKPCPVNPTKVSIEYRPHPEIIDIPVCKEQPTKLKMRSKTVIFEMEGLLCNYVVNTKTGEAELKDGIITGLLDKASLGKFITELTEIQELLRKG